MEVKINYVVHLEDVVSEVARLLPIDVADPNDKIEDIRQNLLENRVPVALSLIEDLRRKMYTCDQRLADCQAVLRGYLDVKNPPPEHNRQEKDLDIDLEQFKELQKMIQPSDETTRIVEKGGEDDSPS